MERGNGKGKGREKYFLQDDCFFIGKMLSNDTYGDPISLTFFLSLASSQFGMTGNARWNWWPSFVASGLYPHFNFAVSWLGWGDTSCWWSVSFLGTAAAAGIWWQWWWGAEMLLVWWKVMVQKDVTVAWKWRFFLMSVILYHFKRATLLNLIFASSSGSISHETCLGAKWLGFWDLLWGGPDRKESEL